MKAGVAVSLVVLLVASACGGAADKARPAISGERATSTSAPATTAAAAAGTSTTTVPPATSAPATTAAPDASETAGSESVGTSDADWDVCLVTGPAGRKYEWLNYTTWMSLERQRREIGRALHPDGEATTARATPGEVADGGGVADGSDVADGSEAADHAALIGGFVRAGCDLVVTIGAEAGDATAAAAHRHPDVDFIGIDQHHDVDLPNLAGLVFPEDRGGFLVGALAASATVTGIVAVVLDSATDPASVGYRTGFADGVAHVDPDVEVLVIAHPGGSAGAVTGADGESGSDTGSEAVGEPDATWGAAAANQALDGGADVVFSPGAGSGRGALEEVAGTGDDARNGALCIGAEADDWFQVIKARRCMLTSVHKLPNEFHDLYWSPGRPANIEQYADALGVPDAHDRELGYSTLALISGEFLAGGNPSGTHLGPIGLWFFNSWGAHKTGVPNRPYRPSDELTAMLADLTGALWRGEVPGN